MDRIKENKDIFIVGYTKKKNDKKNCDIYLSDRH